MFELTELIENPSYLFVLAYVLVQIFMIVFFLVRRSKSKKCPVCGNPYGTRVKRPLHVKVFLFFIPNVKYYSCLNCGSKFFSTFVNRGKKETAEQA